MSMKNALLKGICSIAAAGVVMTAASGLIVQNNVEAAELYQVTILKVRDTTLQGGNQVISYGAPTVGGAVGAAILAKNNQGVTVQNAARAAIGAFAGALVGQKAGEYMDSSDAKHFIILDEAGKRHTFTELKTDANKSCQPGDEALVYLDGQRGQDLHVASCDTPIRVSLSQPVDQPFANVPAKPSRHP